MPPAPDKRRNKSILRHISGHRKDVTLEGDRLAIATGKIVAKSLKAHNA
jgi:hypothetical protein